MLIRILAMGFALQSVCGICAPRVVLSQQIPSLPSGNLRISAPLLDSEVVISTTQRLAGAIDAVTWRGRNFIDSTDHGRQLQSASNFDAGSPMIPETFNPTEAGSVFDGAGPTSSSRLLHALATGNRLQTTTQMAKEQQAAIENSQQSAEATVETIRNRGDRVGRNDPCPCGSGRKFKACHGKRQAVASGQ